MYGARLELSANALPASLPRTEVFIAPLPKIFQDSITDAFEQLDQMAVFKQLNPQPLDVK
jgi:hypothetical protein